VRAIIRDEEHHMETYHNLANNYKLIKNGDFPDSPSSF
jgi:hypothetical protein